MFIVAPISRTNEVDPVIDAGADELYCGMLTPEQLDHYANVGCLNRRAEPSSNLSGYGELREVVKIASARKVPVSLTLNEFYDERQLRGALAQLEKALEIGVRRFIVSDIGLLSAVRKGNYPGIELHISSCTAISNSSAIGFYMAFDPSRVILNRHLSLPEIQRMQESFPGLDKEVFLLNERCYNIDGLCTFLHGRLSPNYNLARQAMLAVMRNMNMRLVPRALRRLAHRWGVRNSLSCCYRFRARGEGRARGAQETVSFNEPDSFLQACGVCALREFSLMGIRYLKIPGRSLLVDKTRDIRVLKEAVALLSTAAGEEEFREGAKRIVHEKYGRACAPGYCYYSDAPLNAGLSAISSEG